MRIWLIESGEPLPVDPGARLMRTGHLARTLAAAGHNVVWWTTNFDHSRKQFRCQGRATVAIAPNYTVELLDGVGYRGNVSLRRLISHIALGREFAEVAPLRERPEIILTALPTLELCEAALRYGRRASVPVVVDVLDIWPETYLSLVPRLVQPLVRPLLATEFRRARRVCGQATALFAVSNDYLQWSLGMAGRERRSTDAVFLLGHDPVIPAPAEGDREWLDELGIREEHVVACFIGMFGAAYDVATIIAAARLLHTRGAAPVRFVIAGDGPRARQWRALAHDLPNLVFTGWLTGGRIHALLRRADIGLAAYTGRAAQSLPYKPFEYMAGGLAMLSSLEGELAELLEREAIGLSYAAGDAEGLASLLERLAREPETIRGMGRRARSLSLRRFSTAVITPAMMQHLEQIAGRCRAERMSRDAGWSRGVFGTSA